MPDKRRKIRSVRLGAVQVKKKPKDVSQKEWDSFKEARKRAKKAAKEPHIFAEVHRRLRNSTRRQQEALRKRTTIGGG